MFHYRPVIPGRQFRILIAAFTAIAVHIALIGLTVDRKPDFAPDLSLPRSVNVFLGQNIALPPENTAAEEVLENSTKERLPVQNEVETVNYDIEEPGKPLQSSLSEEITAKPVKKLSVEKNQAVQEQTDIVIQQSPNASKQEIENLANNQLFRSDTETVDTLAGEGVKLPGAIQMAHPRYQLNAPPAYPGLARKRGQQGTVILQVLVNREGRVEDLKIDLSSSFSMLDHAAIKAVKNWRFEPGRRDDEKVVMWVKVPVTFKLKNK